MITHPAGTRQRRSIAERLRHTRSGGAYTAVAVLAFALLVSIVGSFVTYHAVSSAYAQHVLVDQAQTRLDALYRQELEEDSRLRGYLASGNRLFLAPYSSNEPTFNQIWLGLREASRSAGLQDGDAVLFDLRKSHDEWTQRVKAPLIAHPTSPDEQLDLSIGKVLTDRFTSDYLKLKTSYDDQARAASRRIQTLLVQAAIYMAALILLFGAAAIIADVFRSRTLVALDRERTMADTLQRAFLSGWDTVPHLRIGTAYVSSTREAAVGGDLFDIHRIDEHRCLLLVADVSGKGINAAVETAQVKYSIRTLVEDYADPAAVLARFNRSFISTLRDPASFVSVFVGILDDRDWTLRYASGGHAPAFVRRAEWVEQLPVTGPVLGVANDFQFSSVNVAIAPGDTIVLATDGLTEARDGAGVPVDDDGVIRWIRDGERDPEHLASELINKVTRFAGGRINDDLALLVIRIEGVQALPSRAPSGTGGASEAETPPSVDGENPPGGTEQGASAGAAPQRGHLAS